MKVKYAKLAHVMVWYGYLHPLMLIFLTVMIRSQHSIMWIKHGKGRKSERWKVIMKDEKHSNLDFAYYDDVSVLIRRRELINLHKHKQKVWQFKIEKPMLNCLVPAILGTPFT